MSVPIPKYYQPARVRTPKLITAVGAAEILEVSVAQCRRLLEELELAPAKEVPNPHYRSGPPMRLYAQPEIVALRAHPQVIAARCRVGGRAPKDYVLEFRERFASPAAALGAACDAMFELNRYTRQPTCSPEHRAQIFALKAKLIEHLYKLERHTDRVVKLTRTMPEQQCVACDGDGFDGNCERCSGTGIWREAREVASFVFTFTVEGQRYTWVQPDHAMTFEPRVEETRRDDGVGHELDTTMHTSRRKLAEAKALVRYVLSDAPPRVATKEYGA